MVRNTKKVNFYRLALRKGRKYRMQQTDDDCLQGTGGGCFFYLAPVFDSMNEDETWHRLCLNAEFEACKYEIFAAATNIDLSEILSREDLSEDEIIEVLKEHSWIRKVNTSDMLLHNLQGRYLWVLILVFAAKVDSEFLIEGFHVEFPQSSFVEYLPEIYQEGGRNSFFERYMAVLQTMYEDLEKEVDDIPEYLDYELTNEEHLRQLSKWTGSWSDSQDFSPEQLRFVLGHLQEIQSGRGTKKVMEEMIELLTGCKAMIVEYFKWHDWMKKNSSMLESYEQLFGKNEDTFTVIIDTRDTVKRFSKESILKFLEDYTPLGMYCNVVLLDKSSHMNTHCYLDKNSYLSVPQKADTQRIILGENYILT